MHGEETALYCAVPIVDEQHSTCDCILATPPRGSRTAIKTADDTSDKRVIDGHMLTTSPTTHSSLQRYVLLSYTNCSNCVAGLL